MKPKPRPLRASDNRARGLQCASLTSTGREALPWPYSSRADHGARRESTGHSLSGCLLKLWVFLFH